MLLDILNIYIDWRKYIQLEILKKFDWKKNTLYKISKYNFIGEKISFQSFYFKVIRKS